ncbi:MAG: hypothetical protein GX491_02190 [Chloroflexi bacterium]|nr:hypothetical protein [Chloroflexota bacterium]
MLRQVHGYIVPLNGAAAQQDGPRRLTGSRDLAAPPRFAPNGSTVAYCNSIGDLGDVYALDVARNDIQGFSDLRLGWDPGFFQWSADGRGLVYGVAGSGAGSRGSSPYFEIRHSTLTRDSLVYSSQNEDDPFAVHSMEAVDLRSVSPLPGGDQIALLLDPDGDGCRTLHLVGMRRPAAAGSDSAPREVPGLCVEGTLEPGSWSADGGWLVTPGREPASGRAGWQAAARGIYAVSTLPDPPGLPFEMLMELPDPQPDAPAPCVVVRPAGLPLAIDPLAAAPRLPSAPLTDLPPFIPGELVTMQYAFDDRGHLSTGIRILRPGIDRRFRFWQLPASGGSVYGFLCPDISPEGGRMAVLFGEQLIVIDRGKQVIMDFGGLPGSFRGCPVWSADGLRLAVPLHPRMYADAFILGAFSLAGGLAVYSPLIEESLVAPPVWHPDGKRLLAVMRADQNVHHLAEWEVSPAGINLLQPMMYEFDGWVMINDMAYAPDGSKLAILLLDSAADAQLRVIDTADWSTAAQMNLSNGGAFEGDPGILSGLNWLQDGRIGFVHLLPENDAYLSEVIVYDVAAQAPDWTAPVVDRIEETAWSPDGNWLAFINESGLCLLDMRSPHRPVLLDAERVATLDWIP